MFVISITLGAIISLKNNLSISAWVALIIFTGPIGLLILSFRSFFKKKTKILNITGCIVFIIFVTGFVMYFMPKSINKSYKGEILKDGQVIEQGIDIKIDGKIYRHRFGEKFIKGTMELRGVNYDLIYISNYSDQYEIQFNSAENRFISLEKKITITKKLRTIKIEFANLDKEYKDCYIKGEIVLNE